MGLNYPLPLNRGVAARIPTIVDKSTRNRLFSYKFPDVFVYKGTKPFLSNHAET